MPLIVEPKDKYNKFKIPQAVISFKISYSTRQCVYLLCSALVSKHLVKAAGFEKWPDLFELKAIRKGIR